MLIIYRGFPVSAPAEAVGYKKFVTEILFVNQFYRKRGGILWSSVMGKKFAVGRFHEAAVAMYAGVVTRIDVDGKTETVARNLFAAPDGAEIKTRRVVGRHGSLVDGVIIVGQNDALDAIARTVELAEDVEQVGGDGLMTDEFAHLRLPGSIDMKQAEVAQILTPGCAAALISL